MGDSSAEPVAVGATTSETSSPQPKGRNGQSNNTELVANDPNDPDEEHSLIPPNENINWNCPCFGGMASGPCGEQFKSAFSCFHYSMEEVKSSDYVDQFRAMQECMQKYRHFYPQDEDEEEKVREDVEGATPMAMATATEASLTKEEGSS
ncbi:mitochondrial intermembrane space import and assembly protein 40-like [Trichosurus vulpecula]|uniref:mitochondrial intermembrane space import and assembly protein 40-like n=1 Tax=Trichosurus vulpecula TaxID=9337 RepID=UPI00186B2851|nr:mitochondrial intermembrane space import and assembly protein 40-like [Trichosurus vulpecula]